jgi:tripartite-type tricarboxylate transporter receptor subunit TctC
MGRTSLRGHTLLAALICAAALSVAVGAAAQTTEDYPNRPIRIIVTQAAGSGVDLQARHHQGCGARRHAVNELRNRGR